MEIPVGKQIKSVTFPAECGDGEAVGGWYVGSAGITKIEADEIGGNYCMIPTANVYEGDRLHATLPLCHTIEIIWAE